MSKLKVGQKLYLIEKSNEVMAKYSKPKPVTISKVTAKYFYLDGIEYKHLRFSIETLSSDDYHQCHLAYAQAERENQRMAYYYEIRAYFLGSKCNFTLEQLRNIKTIMGL